MSPSPAAEPERPTPAPTPGVGPWAPGARVLPADRQALLAALDADVFTRRQRQALDDATLIEDTVAPRDVTVAETAVWPPFAQSGSWTLASGPSSGAQAAPPGSVSTVIPANQDHAPPRALGGYRVHRRLGRGGMGTVYRAVSPRSGHEVAIKLLHARMAQDPGARTRFMREAKAARSLSHRCIVAVHDIGDADGQPYIVMELVRGSTLTRFLDRFPQLPLRKAVSIGLQLAQALAYAHDRGVIHRDIKPGNILLLPDEETIKVADFGIAHMDDELADKAYAGLLGTPQYMSPEQTRGETVDGRSDLFSVGVVLYQMLAGERPFRGDSLVALAQRIATEDPAPLQLRRPDAPVALASIVHRCLAKDPADRFASGHELAQALAAVLGELDIAGRRARQPPRLGLQGTWTLRLAAVTALSCACAAALWGSRIHAAQWQLATDQAQRQAVGLAAQITPLVAASDWSTTGRWLQRAAVAGSWSSVRVLDSGSAIRARVGSAPSSTQVALPGVPAALKDGRADTQRVTLPGGGPGLQVRIGLQNQGQTVGTLEMLVDATPWLDPWQQTLRSMVAAALTVVLVVSVAAWFMAGTLARSLCALTQALDNEAVGHRDPVPRPLDVGRRDELGALHQSFDALVRTLRRLQ